MSDILYINEDWEEPEYFINKMNELKTEIAQCLNISIEDKDFKFNKCYCKKAGDSNVKIIIKIYYGKIPENYNELKSKIEQIIKRYSIYNNVNILAKIKNEEDIEEDIEIALKHFTKCFKRFGLEITDELMKDVKNSKEFEIFYDNLMIDRERCITECRNDVFIHTVLKYINHKMPDERRNKL